MIRSKRLRETGVELFELFPFVQLLQRNDLRSEDWWRSFVSAKLTIRGRYSLASRIRLNWIIGKAGAHVVHTINQIVPGKKRWLWEFFFF